jgi:hypothetical protein
VLACKSLEQDDRRISVGARGNGSAQETVKLSHFEVVKCMVVWRLTYIRPLEGCACLAARVAHGSGKRAVAVGYGCQPPREVEDIVWCAF